MKIIIPITCVVVLDENNIDVCPGSYVYISKDCKDQIINSK